MNTRTVALRNDTGSAPGRARSRDRSGAAGAWAFFRFEMRRHLPAVGVLLLAVFLFDLVLGWTASAHGLRAGGDMRIAVAVPLLSLFAVVLSLQLLLTSWLRERADGSLAWLYVRPVSAGVLFAVRLAAALAALVLFTAGGLLVLRVHPGELLDPALLETGAPRLVALALLLFLAASLFTSAVAWSAGAGLLIAVLAAGLGLLLAELPALAAPTSPQLLANPGVVETVRVLLLAVGLPLAFVAGAWVATRRALLDRRQLWRGAAATVTAAGFAFLLAVLAVYAQTHRHGAELIAGLELSEGSELVFYRDADLRNGVYTLGATGGGDEVSLDGFHAGRPPFLHPASGQAMLPLANGEWVLFDEAARQRQRFVAHRSRVRDAAGWSPDGRWFALPCSGTGGKWLADVPVLGRWLPSSEELATTACPGDPRLESLLLVGLDGERLLPLTDVPAGSDWRAAWLDSSHLAVAVRPDDRRSGSWMVVDLAAAVPRVTDGPHELAPGEELVFPAPEAAFMLTDMALRYPSVLGRDLPRREGDLLAWRRGESSTDLVVVRHAGTASGADGGSPGAESRGGWSLDSLASLPTRVIPGGFGIRSGHLATLADGTALWVAPQTGSSRPVYALAPGWSEPHRVCELPPNSLPTAFAGIEDGPKGRRAAWIPGFNFDPESPAPMVSCLLESQG